MKKSKFLILTGAVTLAVLSFYGRKPYAAALKVYATGYGTLFHGATTSVLTSVKGTNYKTVFFQTKNAAAPVTCLTKAGGNAVYIQ